MHYKVEVKPFRAKQLYFWYQCRTQGGGGGAKGAHAPPLPPKRPQGIPCPQKKKLIIDLMIPKASCKK